MSEGLKAVLLAASIVITCGVIGSLISTSQSAQGISTGISSFIEGSNSTLLESGKTKYEGVTSTGSDVINFVRKMQDEVSVSVIRKDSNGNVLPMITFSGDSSITNLPTDKKYINPNSDFVGSVVRNGNEVITQMVFAQTSVNGNASTGSGGGSGGGSGPSGDGSGESDALSGAISELLAQLVSTSNIQQKQLADLTEQLSALANTTSNGMDTTLSQAAQLKELATQVSAITTALSTVNSTLDTLGAKVNNGGYDDTAVVSQLDALSQTMGQFMLALQQMETKVNGLEDKSAVNQETINSLVNTINNISSQIEELKNTAGGSSGVVTKEFKYKPSDIVTYTNNNSLGNSFELNVDTKLLLQQLTIEIPFIGKDEKKYTQVLATDSSQLSTIHDIGTYYGLCKITDEDGKAIAYTSGGGPIYITCKSGKIRTPLAQVWEQPYISYLLKSVDDSRELIITMTGAVLQ